MFSRPVARCRALTRSFSTHTSTPVTATATATQHATMSTATATANVRKSYVPPTPTVTHITPPKSTPTPPPSTPTPQYNDAELVGKNGGQIFVEMMKQHGVKHIFGYPGGAILPIFDGIHGCEDFEFILPRHEQGAGHMAEGYARATGRPGIVLVTSGPGATNTITPMQDALSDGTPMIVFTGQVATTAIGSDAFQEADVLGISRACTKWNTMVRDIADLPRAIREAFHIATSGRPGPVLVDLPKDVTSATLTRYTSSTPAVPYYRRQSFNNQQIQHAEQSTKALQAAQMINNAKRPLLYVGQGALDSSELLRELAIKGNIPVTTTLQGMGCFDELHPLSVHMLGMHGAAYANLAIQNADVIISVGARFDDRVTGMLKKFAPAAKKAALEGRGGIIHLDILSKNINKVVPVDISIVGDAGDSMRLMLPHIKHVERTPWLNEINTWKQKYPFEYSKTVDSHGKPTGLLKPQAVLEELNKQLSNRSEEVIFTTGVGQHQMWAAQYIRWRHPRSMITSGGLGTMGFGLPAAIGAKVGAPDKIVIDIDGDASFSMTGMELATAAEFKVGVKVLLLNNNFQGMVKQWQDLFYQERYSGTVMKNPEWVKLAEAMHCTGLRVTTYEELPAAIAKFIACDGPVVLDAVCCDKEHVYPMVPAGKGLDEMVLGPGKRIEK